MLGGHWFYDGAGYDVAGIGANYSMITSSFLLSSKYLWRQGFLRCPESCSEDTPMDKCVCSCPSEIIGDMSAQEVLNKSGIFDLTSEFADLDILGLMDLDYDGLLDMLCHVGHPGEMFTSAAPYVRVQERAARRPYTRVSCPLAHSHVSFCHTHSLTHYDSLAGTTPCSGRSTGRPSAS